MGTFRDEDLVENLLSVDDVPQKEGAGTRLPSPAPSTASRRIGIALFPPRRMTWIPPSPGGVARVTKVLSIST
ncbi:MAG: hypothetical protein ACYTHN_23955 [Planctomycetota bacterium]|jgi:hypothetical protein